MRGKIAVVLCNCGRVLDINEYELMSVVVGDGRDMDHQPILIHCEGCGNDVSLELELRIRTTSR